MYLGKVLVLGTDWTTLMFTFRFTEFLEQSYSQFHFFPPMK